LKSTDDSQVTFSIVLGTDVKVGDVAQLDLDGVALGSSVKVTAEHVSARSVAVVVDKSALGSAGIKDLKADLIDEAGNRSTKSASLSITYQPDNAVSDGYIKGAEVYLDLNRDGQITDGVDKLVGKTDAKGNFSAFLTSEQLSYDLLARGGIDVSTGLDYLGMLKAPAGSTILNPLTTLVQAMASGTLGANATDAQRAQALADAQATVKQALNLPNNADLTKLDLLKAGLDSSGGSGAAGTVSAADALDMQAKAVMVANMIKTGASALEGATGGTTSASDASRFVIQGLVSSLKAAAETGQTVELADATSIASVLTAAVETASKDAGVTLDSAKAADAMNATSVALAGVNEFIKTAVGSAGEGGNAAEVLTQVVQAQIVAQRDVAGNLKSKDADLTLVTAFSNVADVRAAAAKVDTSSLVLAQNVTTKVAAADTTAPTILRAATKPDAVSVYSEGNLLVFGVVFSEGVLVTKPAEGWLDSTGAPNIGTPTFSFTIGGQSRTAYFDPGQSTGNILRLVYKITGSDTGAIAFTGTSIGGSPIITDLAGNALASTALPSGSNQLPSTWSVQALSFVQTPDDTTPPTVVIKSTAPASGPATGDVTFTFTFSEKVVGFTAQDVDVSNGAKARFVSNAAGTEYTLVVKPNPGFAGEMGVKVRAGQLFDQAGNALAVDASLGVAVDMQPPTVRIESSVIEFAPGQTTAQIKFTLSDSPAGNTSFSVDDVVVSGGSLSNFSGSGTSYSATLTMREGATAVNIGVKPGAYADAQGMLSIGSGFNFGVQAASNFRDLDKPFITVGAGKTFAFSNEGTVQNTADDKQGVYELKATDKVTVAAFAKQGSTTLPADAQVLLDAISSASNAAEFRTAVAAAQAKMDIQFGVRLGDSVNITGDGVAEKGTIAALVYAPSSGSSIVFGGDASAAGSAALQPVVLTQSFIKTAPGKTLAFSNNGTLTNFTDDKQGAYTLQGTEKVTVMVAPKPGDNLPSNAAALLDAIKSAGNPAAFAAAVAAARAVMEVNFGVNLGDGVDISGDKVADKGSGAALIYAAPASGAAEVIFGGDAGSVVSVAVQPTLLTQAFLAVGQGKSFAFSNNGTPTIAGDDKQGAYVLTGTEKVTVVVGPKHGEALPVDAANLLSAIKNAGTVSAFLGAVAAARAKMEVNFGVNLGDNADITGDSIADKGSYVALVFNPPADANSTSTLTFMADSGSVVGGGLQPVVLTQAFIKTGTGKTFAFSNNGTPTNSGDDKQGAFTLLGTERVTAFAAPKPNEQMPSDAQVLLDAIK
ncbi:MAG: Ig-like domain-containing protein, partial [Betaproteobacteria bacterium]